MKIEVTAEDISKGYPGSYGSCPVALAMQRAYGREDISVGIKGWWLHGEDHERYLPFEVGTFIVKFDRNNIVEPFSFELENNS